MSSGTPVGLGYGDFRDRDSRVSIMLVEFYQALLIYKISKKATAIGSKLPQFPPVPHAVHSVSRGHLLAAQHNLQPPNLSLSQKLTEKVEHWFGMI